MDQIAQIRKMFECLPEKDVPIVNKFLDKRQFVEIKEIVDSDVTKFAQKNYSVVFNVLTPTEKDLDILEQYNALKELQLVINLQAAAFIDEEDDIEDYE